MILGLGLLAGVYFATLLVVQRRLLFPRPSIDGALPRPRDAVQVWLDAAGGRIEAWYLPPSGTSSRPSPVLLFFHGNGELIDFWADDFGEPRSWGMGVLLVEYPGYGRSDGFPAQATITEAALAAYDWMSTEPRIDRERVVLHGRSLGGGAAAIVAANRSSAALVLESTFTSVRSFAHRFLAPEFLIRDPFDTLSVVQKYPGPVLVVHGDRDELIPPSHAEALARASRRSQLHLVPGGHNDCPRPWELLRKFLTEHEILRQ
jgi:fermentation-respiration switch protein FrsA (DUF1100 family)